MMFKYAYAKKIIWGPAALFSRETFFRINSAAVVTSIYTPSQASGGVLWFQVGCLYVCVSPWMWYIHPSVFRWRMITWVNINGFLSNGMCIDIVAIWFGIPNGQISSSFDRVICLSHVYIFVSGWYLEWISMDFHQTSFVHWYCSDLVWYCCLWQSYMYLPVTSWYFHLWTITWVNINGFNQTWYVHWYCGDLVWDCKWAKYILTVIFPSHDNSGVLSFHIFYLRVNVNFWHYINSCSDRKLCSVSELKTLNNCLSTEDAKKQLSEVTKEVTPTKYTWETRGSRKTVFRM